MDNVTTTIADRDAVPQLAVKSTTAAEILGISSHTLRNMRSRGEGPEYVRLAQNHVIYRICDLERWLESRVGGGR